MTSWVTARRWCAAVWRRAKVVHTAGRLIGAPPARVFRTRRITQFLGAASLVASIGCGEEVPTASRSVAPPHRTLLADTSATSRAAATVAKGLAVALADSTLRVQLLEHLRDSPFPKHALHADSYLRSQRGAALLARAARALGVTPAQVLGSAGLLRDFALLAPYTATRASWSGDTTSLIVASSGLSREARIRAGSVTGYAVGTGDSVTVRTTVSSGSYVLAIYPVESAGVFGSDPERKATAAPKQNRRTISTTEHEMGALTSTGGAPPLTIPPAGAPGTAGRRAIQSGRGGAGTVRPTVIVCDENHPNWPSCDPEDPPPPPASTVGYGPSDVGGWDYNGCTYAWSDNDADQDGIRDACEYELARAFRPLLAVDIGRDHHLGREPYWAVGPTFRIHENGIPEFQIMYLESWYHDGGDPEWNYGSHRGDSEWTVLHVRYVDNRWVVNTAFTTAHWDTDAESSRLSEFWELSYPDGRYRGRPLIWISVEKHANYATQALCNNGGFYGADHCGGNSFALNDPRYDLEILPRANIGNGWAPAGPRQANGSYATRGRVLIWYSSSRAVASSMIEYFWYDGAQYNFCGWEYTPRDWAPAPNGYDGCAGQYRDALYYLHM